jgi:hypothetical protein
MVYHSNGRLCTMNAYPLPESIILVVVLNNLRDFEIARMLGWYRIPLRSAPKVISVDYLAFYQTAAFKENKWRIDYLAPVLGYELTTREQLLHEETEHPRAKHEYYKIQLGPLQKIPSPIEAGNWRRITFLYTTGGYLQQAHTLNDLVVAADDRPILWRALRERAGKSYQVQELSAEDIAPEILAALLGITHIPAGMS